MDILGAERKGLYATFSITTPSITVANNVIGIAIYQGKLAMAKIIKYPAIIKISPWAKFINRRIP